MHIIEECHRPELETVELHVVNETITCPGPALTLRTSCYGRCLSTPVNHMLIKGHGSHLPKESLSDFFPCFAMKMLLWEYSSINC